MNERIENFKTFFVHQAKKIEQEHIAKRKAAMKQLYSNDFLNFAIVERVNAKTGHVILRFRKGYSPRLKYQKSFTLIRKPAYDNMGNNPYVWTTSFEEFCDHTDWHYGHSDIQPLYYTHGSDPNYDYVGCGSIDIELFNNIEKALAANIHPKLLLFESFPPTEYYKNLVSYMTYYEQDKTLMLEPKMEYEDWKPEALLYTPDDKMYMPNRIMKTLGRDGICIVQGPPGTGKSYSIAQIAAEYMNKGLSVCSTTMTNKGLVELVEKEPLRELREQGRISKTRMALDEQKKAKGLKNAKDIIVSKGNMLCSTNYILSGVYSEDNMEKNLPLPIFDLIIIEEASQAFLTTLSAFRRLGKHCLIVGDPMQLPPIINDIMAPQYKAWRVDLQEHGLKVMALATEIKSYMFKTTFRLTKTSAALTSLFYSENLLSNQLDKVDTTMLSQSYFPNEGGVLYKITRDGGSQICTKEAARLIDNIISDLEENAPEMSLAIICPFRDTIKELQRRFSTDRRKLDITIETIDRIQGMTVDYTILYLPLYNIKFAVNEQRFNVATSRSRTATLIISDVELKNLFTFKGKVRNFIERCTSI